MGATTIIVSDLTAFVGMKVVRGKDWYYGEQDKNSTYGTITALNVSGPYWVEVKWQNGSACYYRIGNGSYDLYLYKDTSLTHGDLRAGDWVELASTTGYYIALADLLVGEKYQVNETKAGSSVDDPNGVMRIKKKDGSEIRYDYWVGVSAFKKCDAPSSIPTSNLSYQDVMKDDWVECINDGFLSGDVVNSLVKGEKYKVFSTSSSTVYDEGYIRVIYKNGYSSNWFRAIRFKKCDQPATFAPAGYFDFERETSYKWESPPKVGDIIVRVGSGGVVKRRYGYLVSVSGMGADMRIIGHDGSGLSLLYFAPLDKIDPKDYKGIDMDIPEVKKYFYGSNIPNSTESLNKNTNSNSYEQHRDSTGHSIQVRKPTPSIQGGKGQEGRIIQGKKGKTAIRCGYIGN